ncbi:MAG TPA: carboxypeptidase-like regulatory domain-containing protein, partial [Terriglobales bacterium]|nr:carboxypeptidase-like regulatory domain-containing protein [Terriglobales bacterium]
MAISRRFSVALVLSLIVALAAVGRSALAQEVTASIAGTVTDPSGAPISGATVVVTDVDRGTVTTVKTNDTGVYNLTRLLVGNYTVKISAAGFQTVTHQPFTLVLNQTARVDVQMKVGQASENVEVVAQQPLLQADSTEVSTVIDANTEVSLPLASRDYLQLTLLAPGTTNVDPSSMRQPQTMLGSGRPYINGNREQANEYLLDGIINSEDKNNEVGYTPGIDAIQEFNLITQNASAEFGNYQGGIVSASIKSGTNNFHGDLFEFFRNDALDANLASAGWTKGVDNGILGFDAQGVAKKPELRYNQFGGTFGGPVIKDKLFFFGDYQGQRMVQAGPTPAQLFTSAARNGDFGQLCTGWGGAFTGPGGTCAGATAPVGVTTQLIDPTNSNPIPNNNLAAYIASPANTGGLAESPVAQALFAMTKYYPVPQVDTLNTNNYFYNSGNHLNNNQGDLRLDYLPSQKDRVFGRWSQMDLNQPTYTGCVFCNSGAAEGSDEPVRNAALDWTHSFGANLLN